MPHNYREPGTPFTQRDRTMIRSLDGERDAAIFIDNGYTHHKNGRLTSTEAGYVCAVEQGKAARKVSLARQQDRDAELKPLPTVYTRRIPDEPEVIAEPLPPEPPVLGLEKRG